MKFLLPLLRNNLLQLSHANQLRYADTKNRTKTITLYMLIAMILMGLLAQLTVKTALYVRPTLSGALSLKKSCCETCGKPFSM